MRARLSILSLSIALGVALAQTTPNPQPQETPQSTPQSTTPQSTTPQSAAPSTPQASTPSESKTSSPAGTAVPTMPEMKIATFKGTLVDMACAGRTASASTMPAPAAGETKPAAESAKASASDANSANRTASVDSGSSCPVSATSSELGMKLEDGRTVRFDLVGNQRAQDALKSEKRWTRDISENKPIRATVKGVMNENKLIVTSIH
jgi:hypothetical protein